VFLSVCADDVLEGIVKPRPHGDYSRHFRGT